MITDVAAESVAVIARLGRGGGEGLIDLFANLLADGSGGIEVGVVAADVERGGEVEEGLAGLEGDGGAASLRAGRLWGEAREAAACSREWSRAENRKRNWRRTARSVRDSGTRSREGEQRGFCKEKALVIGL